MYLNRKLKALMAQYFVKRSECKVAYRVKVVLGVQIVLM